MKGLALVIGAGGIGTQLAKDLNKSEKDLDVVLCGRKNVFNSFWNWTPNKNVIRKAMRIKN